jgi:antitoxin HicB
MMKDLKYYLDLPYTTVVRRDEDGDFVARVDELPGCAAHGKSPEEAMANLEEAKKLWIAESLGAGQTVPEPAAEKALPSGKWVQRVPRSLHRKLAVLARREGVSLNQLVTAMVSEAVGAKTVRRERPYQVRLAPIAASKPLGGQRDPQEAAKQHYRGKR